MSVIRREPRRVRRARRRVAFYADRARRAGSPKSRMKVAADELLSAAAHARNPARAATDAAEEVTEQARWVLAQADLTPGARALYEDQLARQPAPRPRLGAALTCLRAGIGHLPVTAEERDRLYEHYTAELTREAGRLRGER